MVPVASRCSSTTRTLRSVTGSAPVERNSSSASRPESSEKVRLPSSSTRRRPVTVWPATSNERRSGPSRLTSSDVAPERTGDRRPDERRDLSLGHRHRHQRFLRRPRQLHRFDLERRSLVGRDPGAVQAALDLVEPLLAQRDVAQRDVDRVGPEAVDRDVGRAHPDAVRGQSDELERRVCTDLDPHVGGHDAVVAEDADGDAAQDRRQREPDEQEPEHQQEDDADRDAAQDGHDRRLAGDRGEAELGQRLASRASPRPRAASRPRGGSTARGPCRRAARRRRAAPARRRPRSRRAGPGSAAGRAARACPRLARRARSRQGSSSGPRLGGPRRSAPRGDSAAPRRDP